MKAFFENWLRGYAKDYLRTLSNKDPQFYHPHVTMARPFETTTSKKTLQEQVVALCRNQDPIYYELAGLAHFERDITYVPVDKGEQLLAFNDRLESTMEPHVDFVDKIEDPKKLHATLGEKVIVDPCHVIEQYMLRLTAIQKIEGKKLVWFSYDFVTKELLDREQSLDKSYWYKTVHEFTKQTGLLPTRQGYRSVA